MTPSKLTQDFTMAKIKSALDEADKLSNIIDDIRKMTEDLKTITADKFVLTRIDKIIETCKKANHGITNH